MKTSKQPGAAALGGTESESPERPWAPPKVRRLATSAADVSSNPDVDGPETQS